MKGEKEFLKRRVQEALFLFRLLERYKEKMPRDTLAVSMAHEYKEKYEALLKEYLTLCGGDTDDNSDII